MCRKRLNSANSQNSASETTTFSQRRSLRRTSCEAVFEEEQALAEAMDHPDCHRFFYTAFVSTEIGCGLYTSKPIKKGDFVIEFKGQIMTRAEGLGIEKFLETQEPTKYGHTYVFYFDYPHGGKSYALKISQNDFSYFINHSHCNPNVAPKCENVNGQIRLFFIATKDIAVDEEILYDYGDNSTESLLNFPWLKTS